MSANELRKAAETLRDLCRVADEDYLPGDEDRWFRVESPDTRVITSKWDTFADAYSNEAPYIATMNPDVGLALADWLDQVADRIEQLTTQNVPPSMRDHAERVARLINGGAS